MIEDSRRQRAEELLGARVDPVHVLDDDDGRSPLALTQDDGAEKIVRPVAQSRALEAQEKLRRHGNPEEVVKEPRALALFLFDVQRAQTVGYSLLDLVRRETFGQIQIVPVQLQNGAVRHRATVGDARRLELEVRGIIETS